MSPVSSPEESTASRGYDHGQHSLELCNRRSVTVPSSLADSAISLSTMESSAALSSGDKNRSNNVANESQQVFRDSQLLEEDNSPTGSVARDKRKKIGLSRLLRGKQKEL